MAVKFVVAHRADPNNIGDMASNPLQYFLKEDEYRVVDVASINNSAFDTSVPMIVGGGGLIDNSFMGDFWYQTLESSDQIQLARMYNDAWTLTNQRYSQLHQDFHIKYQLLINETIGQLEPVVAPRFVWGAGHNGEDPGIEFAKIRWPRAFSKFKLVGIRDFDPASRYRWTPCASCMHPAFDKKYEIKNDVIWFEHKKQMIKDFGTDPIPRFVNTGNNMDQTIELLGSANTILTNSYHGAYWGTLLKKKVILVGGMWSSKFKFMKYPPITISKKESWKDVVDKATIYDQALEDCRSATRAYWQEIQDNI